MKLGALAALIGITVVTLGTCCNAYAVKTDPNEVGNALQLMHMMSDGVLSDQEKTELEPILKNYYAIQLITKVGDDSESSKYIPASTKEISEAMTERPNYKPSDAVLWKTPDEKTQKESAKLAKVAVDGIYKELAAARNKHFDLNAFTKEKVEFSDGEHGNFGFDYAPVKEAPEGMKIAKPWIAIHISKFVPGAGCGQILSPSVTLPAQMLKIEYNVFVNDGDDGLAVFIHKVIQKSIQPLLDREKALTGEANFLPGL